MLERRFQACNPNFEQVRATQALGAWALGGVAILWVGFAFWFDPDQKILDTFHTDHFLAHSLPALVPAWGAWALLKLSREVRYDEVEEPQRESVWWIRTLPKFLVAAALLFAWVMLFMGVAQLGSQPGVPYAALARLAAAALSPCLFGLWLAWRTLTSNPNQEVKIALAALSALVGFAIGVVATGTYLDRGGWEVGYDWVAFAIALGSTLPLQFIAAALLPSSSVACR